MAQERERKNILELIGDFFLGIGKGFVAFFDPNKKQTSGIIRQTSASITNVTPYQGTEVLIKSIAQSTPISAPKPPLSSPPEELGKNLKVQLVIEDKGKTLSLGQSYDGSQWRYTGNGKAWKLGDRWIYKYGNNRFELNVFPSAPMLFGIPMRFKVKEISSRYTFGIKCNGKTIFSGITDGDELTQKTTIV